MQYLMYDGRITGIEKVNLTHLVTNDFVSVDCHLWHGYGGIPLWKENLQRIQEQANALQIQIPLLLNDPGEFFRLAKRLLNKNRFYRSGYLHLRLYGNRAASHTVITCSNSREFNFPYAERGDLALISTLKKEEHNPWTHLPCFHENRWRAGQSELTQTPCQQVIFENRSGYLCEAAYTNIYAIRDNRLITPHPSSGCYLDTLRPVILVIAEETGLQVTELSTIERDSLLNMEEVFIASERMGIRWIVGIERKRFLNTRSKQLHVYTDNHLKKRAME